MTVEMLLTRTMRGLEAADDDAREKLRAWKLGQPLKCEVRLARDSARMRYYWGLVDIVRKNTDRFTSKEEVSDSIKLGVGHVNQAQVYDADRGWRIVRTPKSISFARMDEVAFQDFIQRAEAYCCAVLSITSDQLADALTDYLAPGLRRQTTARHEEKA